MDKFKRIQSKLTKTEIFMKDLQQMLKEMGMGRWFIKMEMFTKANGKMIKDMEKER